MTTPKLKSLAAALGTSLAIGLTSTAASAVETFCADEQKNAAFVQLINDADKKAHDGNCANKDKDHEKRKHHHHKDKHPSGEASTNTNTNTGSQS